MIDSDEIQRRFTAHPGDRIAADQVRLEAASLAQTIVEATPASREQSLAITALEEAVFWANAAIARPSR